MKNKIKTILLIFILLNFELSFGHGEDKPGPNGGHIRMPGAFHTELVVDKNNKFKVYLLDLDWKNPTVQNSSVQLKVNSDKNLIRCEKNNNYFQCQPTQIFALNKANTISIIAIRDGAIGAEAIYVFPLKDFTQSSAEKENKKGSPAKSKQIDHSNHH